MAVAGKKERQRGSKPRPSAAQPRSTKPPRPRRKRKSDGLPGWTDLTSANQRSDVGSKGRIYLEHISTPRFALLIVGIAVLFTLYVGHVHATQDLLADLQASRQENLRLHLKYNRLKGEFDRMVGPSVIYRRAQMLGLVEVPAFGPVIEIEL